MKTFNDLDSKDMISYLIYLFERQEGIKISYQLVKA